MSQAAMSNLIAALKTGAGLKDEFITTCPSTTIKLFPIRFRARPSQSKRFRKVFAVMPIRKTPTSYFSGTFTADYLRRQDFPFLTWP